MDTDQKLRLGIALAVLMVGSLAVASRMGTPHRTPDWGVHGNVSFEDALDVLLNEQEPRLRLSAQAIILERIRTALAALRSPRSDREARQAEEVLQQIREASR